jgi:acetyl esterase/lipase
VARCGRNDVEEEQPVTEPTTLVIERHGPASLSSRVVSTVIAALVRPRLAKAAFGPRELRRLAELDAFAGRYGRPPRGTYVRPVSLEGFGAEWVHGPGVPASGPREKVLLYFHGGGWVTCGLNTHRRMVSRFSTATGLPALSVDYRMVPAVSFREEVEDCLTAYRHLLGQGVRPENIVVAGDSAGGYLAFAMPLRARDEDLPMPAAIIALSPMVDMDLTAKRAHANVELDPTAPLAVMEAMVPFLLADADPADPAVSPVYADLRGLPPVLICASSTELLYCDAELMARRLAAAGVPCTLKAWDRQLHVFQMFGPFLPESRAAIAEMGDFARAALGRSAERLKAA